MSLTPALQAALMTQSQANKDVTINAALVAMDRARGYLAKSIAGTGNIDLTSDESRYGVIELTGTLTGNRTVTLPTAMNHSLILKNNTTGAFYVEVRWGSGTAIRVPRGCSVPIRKNSTTAAYDQRGGNVKLPAFIAHRITSNQNISFDTETVIQWNNETLDNSESFDSTTNYRFTAPAPGLYTFHAQALLEQSGAANSDFSGYIALRKNGTVIRYGDRQGPPDGYGDSNSLGVTAQLVLALSDYVDVVIYRGSEDVSVSRVVAGATYNWFEGRAIYLE